MSRPGASSTTRHFKPYPAYKDPGVEGLGDIPAHWEVKRLWHLTPFDRRIMYGIVLPGPNVDGGVPIVKGGDVSADRLHLDRLSRTTVQIEAGYARSRLRGGDLVYAIRGSIGEVAIVPAELEGANLTQDAARIAFTTATHGPWLLYALRSTAVFAQLEAGALGATIRGINIRDLKRASMPVPPRVEQEAIARFLGRETARIDALVTKKRRLIQLLHEKRDALIARAVTKGLNPGLPMKESGVDWVGRVPTGWAIRRIAMAAIKITNGYVGPTRDILVNDGVRYLQSLHIKNGRIDFDRRPYYVTPAWSREHLKSELASGDVLIVQTGDIGQVAAVSDEYAGSNCHALIVIRLKPSLGQGEWLARALQSDYGQAWLKWSQTGALHPHLECGHVREIRVAFPPPADQLSILEALEASLKAVDAMVARVHEAIDRLKELRTALISAAVTGKIDVREEGE